MKAIKFAEEVANSLWDEVWEEITEHFLKSEYERIIRQEWNLRKLTFAYWQNKILR